jgi:hypothetical protein
MFNASEVLLVILPQERFNVLSTDAVDLVQIKREAKSYRDKVIEYYLNPSKSSIIEWELNEDNIYGWLSTPKLFTRVFTDVMLNIFNNALKHKSDSNWVVTVIQGTTLVFFLNFNHLISSSKHFLTESLGERQLESFGWKYKPIHVHCFVTLLTFFSATAECQELADFSLTPSKIIFSNKSAQETLLLLPRKKVLHFFLTYLDEKNYAIFCHFCLKMGICMK